MRSLKKRLAVVVLASLVGVGFFSSLVQAAPLDLKDLARKFTNTNLALQVGLDYSLLGLAMVNAAKQPVFLIGTDIIGLTLRVTFNAPNRWEVEDMANAVLKDFPSLSQEDLMAKVGKEFLGSRVLFFFEAGFMALPISPAGWLPIPFAGLGAYLPLGNTQSFFVIHGNFPLIGGIGVIYVF